MLWTTRAWRRARGDFRIEKRAVDALWKRDAPRDLPVYPEVPYAFFGFQQRLAPHLPPTRRSVSSGLPYSAAWGVAKVNRSLWAGQQQKKSNRQATRGGLTQSFRTRYWRPAEKCAKS